MGALHGHRFSMIKKWLPSERFRFFNRIPTSSGSARERGMCATARLLETAFTNQRMAARPGATWVWMEPNESAESSFILTIPMSPMWLPWEENGEKMQNAVFSKQMMVAGPG